MLNDIIWFKENILPTLREYQIEYRSFENGDFGDVERVEFEGNNKGGSIDFWSTGWLGIHAYNYKEEQEIINVLLEPEEHLEKTKAFEKLQEILR
jgi:hypothetical protein